MPLPLQSWSLSTKRIQLVVAYDGTDFCGWAAQKGLRTVHSILTTEVRQITGEETVLVGASRTDSGAHAKGQVCHFETEVPIEPSRWATILNRKLPGDLAVVRSKQVPKTCHSRFSPLDRHYRYRIHMGVRDPERDRYTFNTWYKIDAGQIHLAAQVLQGVHDFRGFSEELEEDANSIREIYSIQVSQRKDEIHLDIVGTAFLRGMMRRIAGGLFEVGRGHRPAKDLKTLLNPKTRDSLVWPVVLPARGLTLMKIRYGRPYHGESQLYEKETNLEQTIREMNNE